MEKKDQKAVPLVDNLDALNEKLRQVREAQRAFATYTQEQVDNIFYAAAMAANRQRIPLAKMAVAETGMGVVEDKVIKNHYAAEYIYNQYKNTKTCGVLESDPAFGVQKIAEPIGVVAAVIPTTNPTSTAIFKALLSLKTRNGIVISPHPRAKKCTIEAARVVLEAAVAAGAPENIIAWIDVPSLELTNAVMKEADIILATGGPGMVKAAYSSGKPALGVGAGNTPAIIDKSADILLAVNSIIHSKTFDNGMICASEQSVIVDKKVYAAVKKEFAARGCYFLNPEETEKVRKTILINGALNAKIVGQKAHTIAALADVKVPEETKILIGEVESVDIEEEFAHEKLSPVLAMYKADSFEDAVKKAEQLVADGGYGHTSSLYIDAVNEKEKIGRFAAAMKTCRILVNTPSSQGGIGDLYNFKLAPSLTLGCGSWGGNSVSENVGVKHLLNIKTVAERRENMLWFRAPEKVYFKKGCMPVALDELGTIMHKKKAFIVTDTFLYQNGYVKPIEEKLDEMGIQHTCFYEVAPDPTLTCAKQGAAAMTAFGPDVIIGLGGGSIVRVREDGSVTVGPDSVGYEITKKALVFGGDVLTATDIAVRLGMVELGDASKVAHIPEELAKKALAAIGTLVEDAIDSMKVSSADSDVILVGGGSIVLPEKLAGAAAVVKPDHFGCANAIGSAISKVSGTFEKLINYDEIPRDKALEQAKAEAVELAVAAGAIRETVEIIEVEDVPLAYYAGNTNRVKIKAAGDLAN